MSNIGNGNKGRFSDRLKRMRYNRLFRKKKIALEDGEIVYKNFLKVVAIIPLMVAGNILETTNDKKKKIVIDKKEYIIKEDNKKIINDEKQEHKLDDNLTKEEIKDTLKTNDLCEVGKEEDEKISSEVDEMTPEEINEYIAVLKKGIAEEVKSNVPTNMQKDVDTEKIALEELNNEDIALDKQKDSIPKKEIVNGSKQTVHSYTPVQQLEKKIINLIKKDLVKIINTLEIYESELYILNEINNDEKTLKECQKNIAEVKKILGKIDSLKKRYDYLKDNIDFEYLLELGDDNIIDKITELRTVISNDKMKTVVSDYKLLDAYKYLYTKVEDVKEKTIKIEKEKITQEEKLKKRDIDFENLKNQVFDINKIKSSYESFVNEQNSFLNELSDKINKIDSHEITNYNLKGFGKYLFNSFKYVGLLMLNPLKGIVPSIATQTIIAGNIVRNLRNNLAWEEKKRMVYEAEDFSSSINFALNDLDYTSNSLDDTLDNLAKLKLEYNNKFKQYQGDFLEYADVINKITSMQESLINNKIKLEIIRNQMRQYSRQNENKLQLVRQLNSNEEEKSSN